jgi:WD40 repeat protein
MTDADHGREAMTRIPGAGALVLMALAALPVLGGCTTGAPAAGAGERAAALAKLTAVVAAPGSAETPAAPAAVSAATAAGTSGSADATRAPEAAATPAQAVGAPTSAAPTSAAGAPIDDPQRQYQATQVAANATAGIADVSQLVARQPPLATFTPAPGSRTLGGRLVYVRNGRLYVADAAGNRSEPLKLRDGAMPAVWAPPDDPGRAWLSPDGRRLAVFAGSDAQLWIVDAGSGDNRAVSTDNLPSETHDAAVGGGARQSLRLRPGQDYTILLTPGGQQPLAVLVDDNSRHIRGEGRLRVVHAAAAARGRTLVPYVNGKVAGEPMTFGRSSGNERVLAGPVNLEIRDEKGQSVAVLPSFELAEHELKTVFLYGDGPVQGTVATYEPGEPPGGSSRTRVFNAGPAPLDLTLDGSQRLATALAAGALGDYQAVPAVMGSDQRRDAQLSIYGLRPLELPVVWSPDSQRLAFIGGGDGQLDLYLTDADGPAQRLTRDGQRELNPVWSPDGNSLAWLALDDSFNVYSLWVLRPGQPGPTAVDLGPVRQAEGWTAAAPIHLPQGVGWADNDRIFFYPNVQGASGGIWTYDTARNTLRQVFDAPVDEMSYSPQAQAWAFVRDDDVGTVWVLPLDEAAKTVVAKDGHFPLWSPDGKVLSWVEGSPLSTEGWRIHAMNADGSRDRVLTDWLPLLQEQPPVPGPNAKRYWLDGGKTLVFTRVGRDYGLAERRGLFSRGEAGNDIENAWRVPVDGSAPPAQATDLLKVFYLRDLTESRQGDAVGLIGFSYRDRVQQLWTLSDEGGKPIHIDAGVRWFAWVP